MGGMGGGIIFNIGRDIAIDGTMVVELQPTDEYLRITSAGNTPCIAGFKDAGTAGVQDRVFILRNVSGVTVALGQTTPDEADEDERINVGPLVDEDLENNKAVFMHYHIGTRKWYILTRDSL